MGDQLETILEQTASLRAALPGDSPTGADVSLEPEFERIKFELEKLSNLEGGDVDWRAVVEGAEDLLANKTKDLRLAVWLTAGGVERSEWRGLLRGLVVCRALITEFWDALYPKRDKARTNIAVWLGERVAPRLESLRVTLENGDDVRSAAALIEEIDRALADKLGDAFPGIRGFVSAAKARVRDIPEPPPPPPPPPSSPPSEPEWADDEPSSEPSPPPLAAPVAPVAQVAEPTHGVRLSSSAADAAATVGACAEALVALARSMVGVEPSRAWPYRLHRDGIWLPFEEVPVENGVLQVPGPDEVTVERLGELFAAARWHELVVLGEDASARFPLWLDPQRLVAIALERSGAAYVDAREAVGRAATDFVRRKPFLLESRFADGRPAAGPETIDWFELESKRWAMASRTASAFDGVEEASARFAQAKELVSAGRGVEGLAIAVQLARRGADARERFVASLDVARLAMNAGVLEIARPILEELAKLAEQHALETWEPSLCVRLYVSLYRCLPADAPLRAQVFESLCRLDGSAAFRLQRGSANGHTTRGRAPVVALPTAASQVGSSPGPATPAAFAPAPAMAPKVSAPPPSAPLPIATDSEWADDD